MSTKLLSVDSADIEVIEIYMLIPKIWNKILINLTNLFKNLLVLNPRIKPHASLVPTIETKKQRQYWKRDQEKNCTVCSTFIFISKITKTMLNWNILFYRVAILIWLTILKTSSIQLLQYIQFFYLLILEKLVYLKKKRDNTHLYTLFRFFFYFSLIFQGCRHIGHDWLAFWFPFIHFIMQCIWKQWLHCPHTNGPHFKNTILSIKLLNKNCSINRSQSSPGYLQSEQHESKAMRQMPQLSSLATHFQTATPV